MKYIMKICYYSTNNRLAYSLPFCKFLFYVRLVPRPLDRQTTTLFQGRFCKCRHPQIYVGHLQKQSHLTQLIQNLSKWQLESYYTKIHKSQSIYSNGYRTVVEIQRNFKSIPGDPQVLVIYRYFHLSDRKSKK